MAQHSVILFLVMTDSASANPWGLFAMERDWSRLDWAACVYAATNTWGLVVMVAFATFLNDKTGKSECWGQKKGA